MQFPTVLGAVIPVINLPDTKIDDFKLTGRVLADIFQGKIKNWNDPAILKLTQK